ncbi:DUF484 family protein [Marinobacterium jannaschii]|uniref:DUF484 family protein n=1 Tax=Marinobacterium jannaschii TaxID=64970 RepID=UPI0004830F65|nr:DUF484 family protein [Marinobacterium jannaschii]
MSNNTAENSQVTLDEAAVAEFLSSTPDFFSRHQHLLAELYVPHDSGRAVSLVERQTAVLREKNQTLAGRLSELVDIARFNDLQFNKTRRMVLSLLEAHTLDDVAVAIDESLCQDFNGDETALILFSESAFESNDLRCVHPDATGPIEALISSNLASVGQLNEAQNRFVFGEAAIRVQSAAVVPLVQGETIGLLAVGSYDAHYFQSSQGTLLLSYVGEVLSRVVSRLTH